MSVCLDSITGVVIPDLTANSFGDSWCLACGWLLVRPFSPLHKPLDGPIVVAGPAIPGALVGHRCDGRLDSRVMVPKRQSGLLRNRRRDGRFDHWRSMGGNKRQSLLPIALNLKAAFVDQPMMPSAQKRHIALSGGTSVGPMVNVVGRQPLGPLASGEAAGAVSGPQGPVLAGGGVASFSAGLWGRVLVLGHVNVRRVAGQPCGCPRIQQLAIFQFGDALVGMSQRVLTDMDNDLVALAGARQVGVAGQDDLGHLPERIGSALARGGLIAVACVMSLRIG